MKSAAQRPSPNSRRSLAQPRGEATLRLTPRGERVAKVLSGLTILGLVGVGGADVLSHQGYTNDQIKRMHMEKLTVGEQEGSNPDDILSKHEPSVEDNQDNATSLANFIRSQGSDHLKDGEQALANGQQVEVPVPDGVSYSVVPLQSSHK